MPTTKIFIWKDPRQLTLAIMIAMVVNIAWAIMSISIYSIREQLSQTSIKPVIPYIPDIPADLLPVLLTIYIPLSIIVLANIIIRAFWILSASRNAHILKGRPLSNSPIFAAVWWYLIPFMSLFKPWESLAEIWDVSTIDRETRQKGKYALAIWWFSYIAFGLLINIGNIFHIFAFSTIAMLAGIVEYISFMVVAKRLCDMQIEKRLAITFSDAPTIRDSVFERLNV